MANRFTNITPSQFNPLSVDEIMTVPLAKQRQHEVAQAQASQLAGADVNRLAVDDSVVTAEIEKLRGVQTEIEDQLMTQGIGKGINKKLLGLKRNREQFLAQDGLGGRAQSAYDSVQANIKSVQNNKNLSQQQKNAGIQYEINQYTQAGGAEANAKYNPYSGSNYVNVQQRALDIAKEMTPQTIAGSKGWTQMGDGTWRDKWGKTVRLTEQEIQEAMIQALGSDEEVISYLQDAQKIGINENPLQTIMDAATTAGNVYKRNDRDYKESMKFQPGYFTGSGGAAPYGTPWTNYDYDPVKRRPSFTDSYIKSLTNIAEGKSAMASALAEGVKQSMKGPLGILPEGFFEVYGNYMIGDIDAATKAADRIEQADQYKPELDFSVSSYENQFNEQQQLENQRLLTKMASSGFGPENLLELPQQQQATEMLKYINEYKDVVFQDAIINTSMNPGPVDSMFLMDTKTNSAQSKALEQRMVSGRARVWDKKTGEIIDKEDFSGQDIEHAGHVAPDNGVQGLEAANENAMVMPHLAIIKDKNGNAREVYVERSVSEMEGQRAPAWDASKTIKRLFSEATKEPGLIEEIPIQAPDPRVRSVSVRMIPKSKNNQGEDLFIVSLKGVDNNGSPIESQQTLPLRRSQVKNKIYDIYGLFNQERAKLQN